MELTHQVCSLELAKRLQELGVKQESLFYHAQQYYLDAWKIVMKKNSNTHREGVSAFTVAELGEMLPSTSRASSKYEIEGKILWNCGTKESESPTEADARAKKLIYLLENNLITL